MTDDPTDSQIALLCHIGAQDQSKLTGEQERDLETLISEDYVEAAESPRGPAFKLTAKARKFLGERGAGLNEA
jgi:hypothetical protein